MPFTIKSLDALQPKSRQYRNMESESRPGFGVQVSPGGKVSFIYLYRTPDKKKRQRVMTLGEYKGMDRGSKPKEGGISLKDAYREYDQWKQVRDGGRDPQIIRDEQLQQESTDRKERIAKQKLEDAQGNIRQLLEAYVDNLKAQGKRSWKTAKLIFDKNVYGAIPENTKAKEVSQDHIKAVLAGIIQRDALVLANRTRAYLSAAFTFGIEWDNDSARYYETLRFGIKINPVRDVPKPLKSEKPRDRALSDTEVKQVWDSLGHSGFHPKTIDAIRLLFALGGQRVEEILKLHADDIDFASKIITLRDTKNGTTHTIPFGNVAEPILKGRLLDINGEGALFGKVGKLSGVMESSTLSHAIKKLCHRIEMQHFQPKDIRRTAKTLMGFAGIRKEDRDRFQNHALTDVSSRHYDRYDYLAEKRQTMAVWDTYLQKILNGQPENNVVQMRSA